MKAMLDFMDMILYKTLFYYRPSQCCVSDLILRAEEFIAFGYRALQSWQMIESLINLIYYGHHHPAN